jgi:hypothetical protein
MSFQSKNPFSKAVNIYLIKHNQNSGAELLHPEDLEQSSSGLEQRLQNHGKHDLTIVS